MFETIVWATDGSETAARALPLVEELAQVHHSKVVAVHANEIVRGRLGAESLLADEPDVRGRIRDSVEGLRSAGIEVDFEVVDGHVGVPELIASAASARGADLIVVGTHGDGGFKAALLGGVTRRLLQIARCPVLAVPPARPQRARTRDAELVGTV